MNVIAVLGTRPEAIKMYPLIKELTARRINVKICISGQHKEMLRSVINEFSIFVDYRLSGYKKRRSLSDITCGVIAGFSRILEAERPCAVLVHGDTTTALGAAMASYYSKVPIAHIEAGLRTYDTENPFPEEFNRRAIDVISDLLFAPSRLAVNNLISEHIDKERIFLTGNTVFDTAALLHRKEYSHPLLDGIADEKLILFTTHRRENIPHLESIYRAVRQICREENVRVIFPVHPNPKIRSVAKSILGKNDRIILTEPLKTVDFQNILARCHIVLTDSGGVQEESAYYKKPTLILRHKTERSDGAAGRMFKLVGTNEENIYSETKLLLRSDDIYKKMSNTEIQCETGASRKIADVLMQKLLFYSG